MLNLSSLTYLYLSSNEIEDITDLSNLTNLEWLDLGNNLISDISLIDNFNDLRTLGLRSNSIVNIPDFELLTSIENIDLSYNLIETIQPLVDNENIDNGDRIDIQGMSETLGEDVYNTQIPALQDRGVTVWFE